MKRTLNKELFLLINGLIGISLMIALSVFFKSTDKSGNPELFIAAENMERSLKIIQDYCIQNHINTGNPEDPQHTGLIGPEWSGITTTIGDPEAKRTTINPNFAALIAHFLQQAGVKKGDTIAVGNSASFPALLVASLAAAKAMELYPLVIISFGSSSFGASNPEFNLWDIYKLLLEHQIFETRPVAASFGGEDDTGAEFEKTITDSLRLCMQVAGIPMISEQNLEKNIELRIDYYFNAHNRRIKAFINSGGAYANIGSSPDVLNIKPGLVKSAGIPAPENQGIIHAMLLKKIPVIHLLYIKGLAQKYNLPWDPARQPEITSQSVRFNANHHYGVLIISLLGIFWFAWLMIRYRKLFNSRK